jgi:hypothetical protein
LILECYREQVKVYQLLMYQDIYRTLILCKRLSLQDRYLFAYEYNQIIGLGCEAAYEKGICIGELDCLKYDINIIGEDIVDFFVQNKSISLFNFSKFVHSKVEFTTDPTDLDFNNHKQIISELCDKYLKKAFEDKHYQYYSIVADSLLSEMKWLTRPNPAWVRVKQTPLDLNTPQNSY